MLMNGKLSQTETSVGQLRATIQDQLNTMSFATQFQQIFQAIVRGTLKSLNREPGRSVRNIVKVIDVQVEEFFISNLQLDVVSMEFEHQ